MLIAGLATGDNGSVWMAVRNSSFAVAPNDGVGGSTAGCRTSRGEIPWASALHRASDGHVWIGGRDGLWRYDGKRFAKALDLPAPATGHLIHSMTDDASGSVESVLGVGLFRHRAGEWQRNGNFTELPSDAPLTQTRDASGRVWFGYGNSTVILLDGERVTAFTGAQGLDVGPITSIAAGRYTLVSGERGLVVFRHGRFVSLKAIEPLALQAAKGIVETADGDVWLNGVRGAVRIRAAAMQRAIAGDTSAMDTEVFDSNEGYPGAGVGASAYPQPKIALATDGRIWLGSPEGLAWTDPRRIQRNLAAPVVVARSLTASGQKHDGTTRVSLAGGTRNLQIDYTALSYSQPERVRFRYRLLGNDDVEWVDAGTRRQAFYTNLGPGIPIQGERCARDGNLEHRARHARLCDRANVRETRTFFAICVVAAIGVLLLAYALRERQVLARAR